MKVLIPVLHRPTRPTGVCRHAANLANCLAASDDTEEVILILGEWQRHYFSRSFNFDPKITLVFIDIKNTSFSRNYWFVLSLPKIAKDINPDIIHMSFPFPFIRTWFDVPIVSTIHDLYPFEFPKNFGYPQVLFNKFFLQKSVSASDGLVTVSHCTFQKLLRYFPDVDKAKRTEVIYNIVDFSKVVPLKPSQFSDHLGNRFLLTVAQHRKNKNLDILIRAFSSLLDSKQIESSTNLIIVGSRGPETNSLINLTNSLELSNNVFFLSGLDDSELRWLYEYAELFVIASSTEGFCLPLAEAISLSCRAVCSDIPIFHEVTLSQCTFFQLDQHACDNLSKAISSVINSSTPQDVKPENRFSLSNVCVKLVKFYRQILSRN